MTEIRQLTLDGVQTILKRAMDEPELRASFRADPAATVTRCGFSADRDSEAFHLLQRLFADEAGSDLWKACQDSSISRRDDALAASKCAKDGVITSRCAKDALAGSRCA